MLLGTLNLQCLAVPIEGPVRGQITSKFGYRKDPFSGRKSFHNGLDIAAPIGTPIYAMQDGFVVFNGWKSGYGRTIIIDHFYSDLPELPRVQTKYAHNSKNIVQKGQYVKRGQVIGYVGNTGRSTGPHVHFEVIYKKNSVNPVEYLSKLPSYLQYARLTRESRSYKIKNRYKKNIGGY